VKTWTEAKAADEDLSGGKSALPKLGLVCIIYETLFLVQHA